MAARRLGRRHQETSACGEERWRVVAVDTNSGLTVRVGGAALASGPALGVRPARAEGALGGLAFPRPGSQRPLPVDPWSPVQTPAQPVPAREVLPAAWAVPAYFSGAPFGPPYELPNRTAEWELSAETQRSFAPYNRASRMATRVHQNGPELQSPGVFLSALYGATPEPRYLGVGLDTWM